jgi:hypothetical protein
MCLVLWSEFGDFPPVDNLISGSSFALHYFSGMSFFISLLSVMRMERRVD